MGTQSFVKNVVKEKCCENKWSETVPAAQPLWSFRLWTTDGRSTVFNGNSIIRRPGPPRIRTVRPHPGRTSSLPDSATCPLPNAQWPSSPSFREKPPSAFTVSLSGSDPPTTLVVASPACAWRFRSSGGGLAPRPRERGREGRKESSRSLSRGR